MRIFSALSPLACLAAGFMMMLVVMPAKADYINGAQLQQYCLSQNPNDDAICIVYITGAVYALTTMDLIADKTNGTERQIGIPEQTSPDDLKSVVMNWLKIKQENLDFAATLLILGAVQDAYSCSK